MNFIENLLNFIYDLFSRYPKMFALKKINEHKLLKYYVSIPIDTQKCSHIIRILC